MDWAAAKKEYIRGGVTYRQLAEKYGVHPNTVRKRAAEEGWTDLRNNAKTKREQKSVERLIESGSKIDEAVFNAAFELLQLYTQSVKAAAEAGPVSPSMLKDYGSALKSIQGVLERPSELDIKEQEARIAKLQKDAAEEDSTEKIEVQIGGFEDTWVQ